MAEGDHLQPANAPQPALPQGFHVGISLDNSPGANISVGQEGKITVQQPTLPEKLAKHSLGYWLVHFLIGVLAAAIVEAAILYFRK